MTQAFLPTPPVLRALSSEQRSSSKKSSRRPRSAPSMSVQRIKNPTDFAAALPIPKAEPLSPLVVFSFITSNCRACKYASNAYRKLASEFGQREVRFCEMDVSEQQNKSLGQQLGVNAVPAFQVYTFKGDGKKGGVGVLDEVVGPRTVGKIRDKLKVYLSDGFNIDDYIFEE